MKWVIAVIVGVVLPYPVNLLMQYIASLGPNSIWYGYALIALMFIFYFMLGMYLASLHNLRATGTGRRFRWPEFMLGAFLIVMSVVMKLEQATGLVSAVDFVRENSILTAIVTFNDGLYLWAVLAGFFMTDAFERVSEESIAQAAALRAEAAELRNARKNARKSARKRSKKSAASEAAGPKAAEPAEPAEPQPGAVQTGETGPAEATPGA